MKILSSNITHLSDNHYEQLNSSLEEKTQGESIRKNRLRLNSRGLMNNWDQPQILVDRVSISQKESQEYQSNYQADIASKSLVKSLGSDEQIEYEQQFAMEKLIGGVIDKSIVIGSIQRGEDVSISNETPPQTQNPETDTNSIQTRSVEKWEMSLKRSDIHFEEEKMDFSSVGEVLTEDGRKINFSLDMSLNRTFLSKTEQETLVHRWQERVNLIDPLVISLDGKAPQLSDATFEFDLNSDGTMENISFVGQGSGFLAFDKNNDSMINDGSELFGPGTGNGFEELADLDEDQNSWIDENDAVFSKLSVWTKNEQGEDTLISLKDAGIGAISLDYATTLFNMTQSDNVLQGQLKSTGMFLFENGNVGSVHQIDLASQPLEEIDEKMAEPVQDANPAQLLTGAIIPPPTQMDEPDENMSNPLKDLLDQIKKLKEEMERMYERMNQSSNQGRFGGSRRRRYQGFNPDSSMLLFGGNKGPIRSRSRYA
ncbi:MAG: hypothetical protein GY699_05620 [Desulfobacteraceae bacterium]|nr:hypothetical protein [Desulfobacteraceae bacterium]